ncbi:piriformospora indica-insensitive protein 2-like [Ipomoea triloba]|uniref:piriformospora indica-insensitive protein 2-like n=1 Tax=Ipomoea triloba TaxID=35885 RepID=UPI00125D516C|nr:piriformospora indica-insensitive protein 2-like [Ipomoea triloba]
MEMVKLLVFVLLLFSLNCQLTMGEEVTESTTFCTTISGDRHKPLGTEDNAAINELLGCSKMISSEKCAPNPTNSITCDCNLEKVCRVTEIRFSYRSFEGELPKAIGKLKNLTKLVLYGNKFLGKISGSYANLTNLKHLDLKDNSLEGPIPHFLGDMKLEFLDLSDNLFSGSIPLHLGSLVNLTSLDLSNNLLSAKIPSVVENFKSLVTL